MGTRRDRRLDHVDSSKAYSNRDRGDSLAAVGFTLPPTRTRVGDRTGLSRACPDGLARLQRRAKKARKASPGGGQTRTGAPQLIVTVNFGRAPSGSASLVPRTPPTLNSPMNSLTKAGPPQTRPHPRRCVDCHG